MEICNRCREPYQLDALKKDQERLNWYEKNIHRIINIGKNFYFRDSYGSPMMRSSDFRDAIDRAMKKDIYQNSQKCK